MANKLPKTIDEQLVLLKQRGMIFKNEANAINHLKNISYYRLKGYWWEMQDNKARYTFKANSYFEEVIELYKNLHHQSPQKSIIATEFGFTTYADFSSFLEPTTIIRNNNLFGIN